MFIRKHQKEFDDDSWYWPDKNGLMVAVEHEIDYYFWIVVDGFKEFDSSKHFRENGRQVPRYYESKKEAREAALEMLHRILNHEIDLHTTTRLVTR